MTEQNTGTAAAPKLEARVADGRSDEYAVLVAEMLKLRPGQPLKVNTCRQYSEDGRLLECKEHGAVLWKLEKRLRRINKDYRICAHPDDNQFGFRTEAEVKERNEDYLAGKDVGLVSLFVYAPWADPKPKTKKGAAA